MNEVRALGLLPTPTKSVSFEESFDDSGRRRRSRGTAPKPWQLASYTPLSKMIMRTGKEHYHNGILCSNAFPDGDVRARNGRIAWDAAVANNPEAFAHGEKSAFVI
jgi:hypothetical protein